LPSRLSANSELKTKTSLRASIPDATCADTLP
jgi:hypothetical protein